MNLKVILSCGLVAASCGTILAIAGAARSADVVKPAAKQKPKGIVACRKDIRRFCAQITPGDGRVGQCLYDHLAELSKSCRRYAGHGGPGHELESLQELDKTLLPPKKTAPIR